MGSGLTPLAAIAGTTSGRNAWPSRGSSKFPGKKLAEAKLPAPPEPIERGLIQFALEYLPAIAPDFQLDSLMEMFLTELEHWVEGNTTSCRSAPPEERQELGGMCSHGLQLSPLSHQAPDPDLCVGRLSAIANQRLRTLIEIALPEGFELAKDSRSKLAFSGNWLVPASSTQHPGAGS